ncbi:ectonucleotide pyrophosphatase/phosphodiesterase [Clostridium thermarum]|uniref:alkaline phosphatase family protein n=1 Tax=Clostridium thermarum TaxID=1716543 RepID=UPI0013CF657D|nr:ectonucleotide pyrophosphatase/phosphodiesterase [Clostridium thermarum]
MFEIPQHLIVVSFDALSTLDFETINSLPNFSQFLINSSYCKRVKSIYPSLTYPAHATIVTGKYPKNHGVINNTLLQPERDKPDWYWYRKYISGPTLYDKAIDRGLKVAALLWPVTGRSRIQYNMPEIFANRPWTNQIIVSMLSGSPLYQFILNQKFGHLRRGIQEPYLDNFVHESALYTIKHYSPNLMLIHYTDLDWQRHKHGFYSKEAKKALIRHDTRLGEIINILKEEGIYSNSAIILLGDHSSLDEDTIIKPNIVLKDKGYITLKENGTISDWTAICKNCDGSAYIYVKTALGIEEQNKLYGLLTGLSTSQDSGIEAVYTKQEAIEMGADPNCAFILEAKKGYYFSDDIHGELITKINPEDIGKKAHTTAATHGYSPYKEDYTTMFFASGKGIKTGTEIPSMNLVDEGPTLARLLGFDLEDADGRVLSEILL